MREGYAGLTYPGREWDAGLTSLRAALAAEPVWGEPGTLRLGNSDRYNRSVYWDVGITGTAGHYRAGIDYSPESGWYCWHVRTSGARDTGSARDIRRALAGIRESVDAFERW